MTTMFLIPIRSISLGIGVHHKISYSQTGRGARLFHEIRVIYLYLPLSYYEKVQTIQWKQVLFVSINIKRADPSYTNKVDRLGHPWWEETAAPTFRFLPGRR